MSTPRVVVVTFNEGDEVDTEVFTFGAGSEDATAWADRFQRWWERNAVVGGRTIEHILITPASDPSFVNEDLVAKERS